MELTAEQYKSLVERGSTWLRMLGHEVFSIEEVTSMAFVSAVRAYGNKGEDFPQSFWEYVSGAWKTTLKTQSGEFWDKEKHDKPKAAWSSDNESEEVLTTRHERVISMLSEVYEVLTEDEAIKLLYFVDANCVVSEAASMLGVERTALHHAIKKIQGKIRKAFPLWFPVKEKIFAQPYERKGSRYTVQDVGGEKYLRVRLHDWCRNLPLLELVVEPSDNYSLWDKEEKQHGDVEITRML